ncbi:MAG: DUF6519 domain-containing protein [Pyrinomonadaceae bacterium]
MRGDFSAWNKDRSQNFRGTLHQQGRVLLDRDWNAQTEVIGEWQETAGRDAFGAGVAAIPAEVPNSFKVTQAAKVGSEVKVYLKSGATTTEKKGRVWADGLLAELAADISIPFPPAGLPPVPAAGADVIRTATYLNPPPGTVGELPGNKHDAVILETWLQELSPFQVPDLLIEPALGGVDTTERVQTAYRFRLYRMTDTETCDSIIPKLKDDFSLKGKLTAKLNDMTETGGDCPVVESGGYTGFEHRLYRIEIADTDPTKKVGSYFKWSQFNGGLVGRGVFDTGASKVDIRANQNAIAHCGINTFYLEALEFDTALGCWQVIYGVSNVTLNADNTLTLPAASNEFTGNVPPKTSGGKEKLHFFRLWNGIERVNDFTAAAGTDLPDKVGIKLKFDAEAAGRYTASDFWTFEARVGQGIDATTPPLVDNKPPHGIFYHRVPLAELDWKTNSVVNGDDIEDCRRPFQPLTKLKTCCTYRVGDGVNSHGDFTKIQDAIDALPKKGGEVCILPGFYEENIVLKAPHNHNVILKGCGRRTVIKAKEYKDDPAGPPYLKAAIYVEHGQNITIESLAIEAHEEGYGIFLEGEERDAKNSNIEKYLKDILLSGLFVSAVHKSAIKGYVAQNLTLINSVVHINETERLRTRHPAVFLEGDDMLIERNEIRVLSERAVVAKTGNELSNDPELFDQTSAQEAAGGLQIGGGSERVRIINNLIVGGTGNGISLGRIDLLKDGKTTPGRDPFEPKDQDEDCCNPDDGIVDDDEEDENGFKAVAGPPLYDILIKFNRIFNMGRNGIGVATFFSLGKEMQVSDADVPTDVTTTGMIVVSKLVIIKNRIERCMNISPQVIKEKHSYVMGYGGISLAVVEEFVVRDNFIVDNCRDCNDPICGIYVLLAIGAEISRNEITEHLPQHFEDVNSSSVRFGPRGGIWIFIAVGQMDLLPVSSGKGEMDKFLNRFSDAHAAKIHENVVSVPLGRTVTLTVFGDVSIVGNRLTSFGLQPVDIIKLITSIFINKKVTMTAILQIMGLLAGNVLIFDLSVLLMVRAYQRLIKQIKAGNYGVLGVDEDEIDKMSDEEKKKLLMRALAAILIKGGFILFADNQCKLRRHGREMQIALSSVLIAGVSDLGFHNNQDSCDLTDDDADDLLITNAALVGGTLRTTANWFKETLDHVAYSAMTFGLMNATTDNESVHCLYVKGNLFLDRHNLVLGTLLAGIDGDITETAGDFQRDVCGSRGRFTVVGARMWESVMNREGSADSVKKMGVDFGGGN